MYLFLVQFYFWEIVEMLRKVILVGLISFYSPGSAGQLTVGILWSTLFVFICNWCQPFTTDFANALKAAMDGAVLVTMVLSLTLKCDLEKPGEDMTLENRLENAEVCVFFALLTSALTTCD